MKKSTKKLLSCALIALFMGASVGTAVAVSNSAPAVVASAASLSYESKTQLDAAPASDVTLEEAKIKNMTTWGYYNVDGEDVWYFSGDGTASGNPEFRFITDGTQTQTKPYTFAPVAVDGFSFKYKLANDDEKEVKDMAGQGINYIVQILASDGTYPIFQPEIVADGVWHTVSFDLTTACSWNGENVTMDSVNELFSGFIIKMGGLNGELMIADVQIKESKTQQEAAPECDLTLETAKIKNMSGWGYYTIGEKEVWGFSGDGTASGNPELRFITDGTQTQTKPYTFAPVAVDSFSFSYKLTNSDEKEVKDMAGQGINYIVQILASDGTYPIFQPEIVADGVWHTIKFDLSTSCIWNSENVTMDSVNELFSGFIVKMGGLNGELMIADIAVEYSEVEVVPQEYTVVVNYTVDGVTERGEATFTEETGDEFYQEMIGLRDSLLESMEGYEIYWEDTNGNKLGDALPLEDCEFTLVYVPIEYTVVVNYTVDGVTERGEAAFTIETGDEFYQEMVGLRDMLLDSMEGYEIEWIDTNGNKLGEALPLADCEYTLVYTAIEYTVSFTHPKTGMIVAAPITYTVENMAEVEFPAVPEELAMEGYEVAWNRTVEDLAIGGLDVNPVWTVIEYTVSFTHPKTGMIVAAPITYTVENMAEVEFPAVPEELAMEGYEVAWNKTVEDLAIGGLDVNPVYTAIEYTITFAGCEGVEAITFTVETKDAIVLPAVPEKAGYTAAWDKTVEDIALEDTTITAVYTEIPVEPEIPESSAPESSAPETSNPTEEPAKKGCGSTVGLVGMTAILGVVGAALVVGKKKED